MMASHELSRWEKKRTAGIGPVCQGLRAVWGRKIGACVRACGRQACVRCRACKGKRDLVGGSRVSSDGRAAATPALAGQRLQGPGRPSAGTGSLQRMGREQARRRRNGRMAIATQPRSACTGPPSLASPVGCHKKLP